MRYCLQSPRVANHAVFGEKTIAAVLMCLLSSIVLLGSSAGPPIVEIPSIQAIEDGTVVKILGVLVDIRVYGSGAEGLTVADLDSGAIIRVISSVGIKPQPSTYVHVGDEVIIVGQVAKSESSPVIFSKSDDLTVLRGSDLVLTVEAVSENWILFEGDTIRIKGVLRPAGSGLGLRLYDFSGPSSIVVTAGSFDIEDFVGSAVTLTATLDFDHVLSMLTLSPYYVVVEQ